MNQEILKMPKVELHCHLDGSLTLASVRKILGKDISPEELQVQPDCQNLAEYLQKFDLPIQCLQTPEGIKKASKNFLLDVAKENVRYVEVRFAPTCSVNDHMNYGTVIESVLDGLKEAKEQCGTFYNVIVCAMRHHDLETNLAMLKGCREFLGEGVCAADLAGDEAAWPMEKFVELFKEAKKLEYPYTIHAGECGRAENILGAVELGAARVGHGIAMGRRKDIMDVCRRHRTGIEMCPVSNLQTHAVNSWEQYPIREFLEEGLLVTLNTDNRTVSGTTLSREMEEVQKHCGITLEELYRIECNTVEVAFADDSVKHELWKMMRV